MGKIVAIGGGEISKGETRAIDEFIVRFSGKEKPNLLFVPTASRDAGGYINVMKRVYKSSLGCAYSTLLFYLDNPSDEVIRQKLEWADIIYVGGGNTAEMMDKWREKGLDVLLKKAYDDGKLLCGLSAGAICWFERGYSDSESFDGSDDWSFVFVDGLSLIKTTHCPHYNEQWRDGFDSEMKNGGCGIALENCTALVVDGERMSIIKSDPERRAYLFDSGNKIELVEGESFTL